MKPTVTIETITPNTASSYLEKNLNNRRMNKNRIDDIVSHINKGKFILSPDAISFDDSGRMYNGQHRLTACVLANKAIECIVLRHALKESFMITDVGIKKMGQHALDTVGKTNSKLLAAVARMVWLAEANGVKAAWFGGVRAVLPNDIVDVVNRHKRLEEICEKAKGMSGREKINCPASVLAYCLWVALEANQYHEMLDFLTRVSLGAGFTVMSPELALQRRLNKFDGFHGRKINNEQCALVLKAFIAKQNKEKVERLQWQEKESFPTLEPKE